MWGSIENPESNEEKKEWKKNSELMRENEEIERKKK